MGEGEEAVQAAVEDGAVLFTEGIDFDCRKLAVPGAAGVFAYAVEVPVRDLGVQQGLGLVVADEGNRQLEQDGFAFRRGEGAIGTDVVVAAGDGLDPFLAGVAAVVECQVVVRDVDAGLSGRRDALAFLRTVFLGRPAAIFRPAGLVDLDDTPERVWLLRPAADHLDPHPDGPGLGIDFRRAADDGLGRLGEDVARNGMDGVENDAGLLRSRIRQPVHCAVMGRGDFDLDTVALQPGGEEIRLGNQIFMLRLMRQQVRLQPRLGRNQEVAVGRPARPAHMQLPEAADGLGRLIPVGSSLVTLRRRIDAPIWQHRSDHAVRCPLVHHPHARIHEIRIMLPPSRKKDGQSQQAQGQQGSHGPYRLIRWTSSTPGMAAMLFIVS